MVNPSQEKILMSAYSVCQTGIAEQPKLRDFVITFYVSVCTLYIGWFNNLDTPIQYLVTLAMIVFGIICILRVVGHRVLNIQYNKCIKIINGLILSDTKFETEAALTSYISENQISSHYTIKSLFTSVGNVSLIGLSFITTIPFLMCVFSIENIRICYAVIISIIYVGSYCGGSAFYLLHRINSEHSYIWLFQTPATDPFNKSKLQYILKDK